MTEDGQTRRSVHTRTVKRGLAWVLALGCGAAGLLVGYGIGERQARMVCHQNLQLHCPKLPTEKGAIARGKGSDLRFYEELRPEGAAPRPSAAKGQDKAAPNVIAKTTPLPPAPKPVEKEIRGPKGAAASSADRASQAQRPKEPAPSLLNKNSAPPTRRIQAEEAHYALQLGSFPTEAEASHLAAVLRAHGQAPRVFSRPGPNHVVWYQVVVGSYTSKEAAQQGHAALKASGATAFIVKDVAGQKTP